MTFTINQEHSKTTMKAPKNTAKIFPKLTKTSKLHDRTCCDTPVVKFGHVPQPIQFFDYIP